MLYAPTQLIFGVISGTGLDKAVVFALAACCCSFGTLECAGTLGHMICNGIALSGNSKGWK